MKPEDDRIDLSPLDPENDPLRLERVVESVMGRLGPGLVPGDPVPLSRQVEDVLATHARAVLVACTVAAMAAGLVLVAERRDGTGLGPTTGPGLLDVPAEWQVWLATGDSPRLEELLITFAGAR